MAIESPLYLQTGTYSARQDRFLIDYILTEGVADVQAGELKVTQHAPGANMSIDIAPGTAVVDGDDVSLQGAYLERVTQTETRTVEASDAFNPRIDLVVLRVLDSAATGGAPENDGGYISVVKGTAAAAPVPPALPPTAIPLAEVYVAANATAITTANITDRRVQINATRIVIDSEAQQQVAEINVRLWQLEATTLQATEGLRGWTGEAFLVNQNNVDTTTGPVEIFRHANKESGFARIRFSFGTARTAPGSVSSVVWTGSQYVAAVGSSTIYTSPDGVTWTARSTSGGNLARVAYNGSLLVASLYANSDTRVFTSTDGVTWTSRTTPSLTQGPLFWAGSRWVLLPFGTTTSLVSTDGITWTPATVPDAPVGNYAAAWNGALAVCVGSSSWGMTSPDGVTWTARTLPSGDYRSVAWTGSLWIAVGTSGVIATSPDGVTWTKRVSGTTSDLTSVVAAGGVVFATDVAGHVHSSPDGIRWGDNTTGVADALNAGCWNGSGFLFAGATKIVEPNVSSATTGTVTLAAVPLAETCNAVYLLEESNAYGLSTVSYQASLNGGTTWTPIVSGTTTMLDHSGTQLKLRVTLTRPVGSYADPNAVWMTAYGDTLVNQ